MNRPERGPKGRYQKKNEVQRINRGTEIAREAKRKKRKNISGLAKCGSGVRLMDIDYVSREMWCSNCDNPLSLQFVEKEVLHGLASIFHVRCQLCSRIYKVSTSKKVQANDSQPNNSYEINLKAALGRIDAGIGASHVNSFLSVLNCPTSSTRILKKCERQIGSALEETAKDSCVESLRAEKELTLQSPIISQESTVDDRVPLAVSYDMMWPKRGNGRSYDSNSGAGTIIGLHTGDVLGYETRNKHCYECDLGHLPASHDCRKNWSGSSKAMEADVGKSLVAQNKTLAENGVRIGVLIGDDDSSTISAIRHAIDTPVLKWSDVNHATASVSRSLFKLQAKHKKLTNRVIKHLKHLFGCALRFNRNDVAGVAKQLRTIADHVFDCHENCGSWCKYREDPQQYKHKGLPYGKALVGEDMKKDLATLFSRLADKADQLAPCGSSQRNESFNAMAVHRVCKARYYGGSEAFDFLIAATVASKNKGCTYVSAVKEKLFMSPGRHTLAFKRKRQHERDTHSDHAQGTEKKRRRFLKKTEKSQSTRSKEQSEGSSYQSGMGLLTIVPPSRSVCSIICEDCVPVIFDIETTGLGMTTGICQLAAKVAGRDESFMRYIMPDMNFSPKASETNGFTINGGRLMLNNIYVETTALNIVYYEFIKFLKQVNTSVVLLGHNANKFDTRLVLRDIRKLGLVEEFTSVVKGFGDTLPLLKKILPKRISYKLAEIALTELGESATHGIHDALRDCEILDDIIQKLIEKQLLAKEQLVTSCIGTADCIEKEDNASVTAFFKSRLEPLQKHISAGMLKKMAECHLTIETLRDNYLLGGADSIKTLLSENINGKPRVTRNKRVMESVISYLASINS